MAQLIYQFYIRLQEIEPPIWRRIQVPDTYTFWGLHVAIQDAKGTFFQSYNPVEEGIFKGLRAVIYSLTRTLNMAILIAIIGSCVERC